MNPKNRSTIIGLCVFFLIVGGVAGSLYIWGWAVGVNTIPIQVVASESMHPTIQKGDAIILTGIDPNDISAGSVGEMDGDIIVYNPNGLWSDTQLSLIGHNYVVHRVYDKYFNDTDQQWYFWTQGDNNAVADLIPVPADHVIGVVDAILPKIGWVKLWITDPYLAFPVLFILGGLVLGEWLYDNHKKHLCELDPTSDPICSQYLTKVDVNVLPKKRKNLLD